MAHQAMGEFARDREYVERTLEAAERVGDPVAIGFMLVRRGARSLWVGEWEHARQDGERALALSQQIGRSRTSALPLLGRGVLYLFAGQDEVALPYLAEGLAVAEQSNDFVTVRWTQLMLAEHELREGRSHEAYARLAPRLDRYGQEESLVTQLLPSFAWAHLHLGEASRAEALLQECTRRATAGNRRPALVDTLQIQALLAIERKNWQGAERALEEALALSRAIPFPAMPFPYDEARVLDVYGQLHYAKGEPEAARELFEAALCICDRLGEGLYRPHIERALAKLSHAPLKE
jgi:tetratricopeptide (TPR) repeat protein